MLQAIVSNKAVYLRTDIGALASLGSSLTESVVFANEISSDLDEIHMRSRWDISSTADEISDEIGRDFMRSDEIFARATTPQPTAAQNERFSTHRIRISNPAEQHNPEEIAG